MVQSTHPGRKQRIEAAIGYALNREWERAAEANRVLLAEMPNDLEAANRLGKALTELDDLAGAIEAYELALRIDPANGIARKNLARLQELAAGTKPKKAAKPKRTAGKRDAATPLRAGFRINALIEESGRSAELDLQRVNADAVPDTDPGDPATLITTTSGVAVQNERGELLGHIEPRAGLRLKRLIEGGNEYAVVMRRVDGGSVTVYVRETYRHPSLSDQASFLPPAAGARRRDAPRAYTRTSVLRYDGDEDDDDDDEDRDDSWPATGDDREDEDDDDPAETIASVAVTDDADDADDDSVDGDPAVAIAIDDTDLSAFEDDEEGDVDEIEPDEETAED